jgi:predicted acyltransferase
MPTTSRLLSLDILRGLTIAFMIIVNNPGSWAHVYAPLLHAKWDGCTPTDLVFPFFVTIVGISMCLSKAGSKSEYVTNLSGVVKRFFWIFIIGVLLNYFPFIGKNLGELRILGVLQRIAMAYLLGGVLLHFIKIKYAPYLAAGLAILYSSILLSGGHTLEDNIPNRLDLWLLGTDHVYKGYGIPFDPEGILGTLGTTINILLGAWIGYLISRQSDHYQKMKTSLIISVVAILIAWIAQYIVPFNKPLWSPSYAIYTSGLCIALLGILIFIVDIKGVARPFTFFKIYGMNALAAFVASGVIIKLLMRWKIGDDNVYSLAYKSFYSTIGSLQLGSLLQALSFMLLIWLLAYAMYSRKIFWRV